jgi:hypothetical protein
MRNTFLGRNGLSVTLVALFLLFMIGQVYFGWQEYNEDQRSHAQPVTTLPGYLTTGHFLEATAENWESEFLQMFAYVLLTVKLYQKGSSESKDPGKREAVDRDPRLSSGKKNVPGPVKHGGITLRLYENSLSIAFLALFLFSIVLHAVGGASAHNAERLEHGETPLTVWEYSGTAQFWFESFQNWQSEFLALLAMVVLSIWLRQRGSPESKPVDAPHDETGSA